LTENTRLREDEKMPLVYDYRKDRVIKKRRRKKKNEPRGRQASLLKQTTLTKR
jgi:hypothetical protein